MTNHEHHIASYGPTTGNSTLTAHIQKSHPKAWAQLSGLDGKDGTAADSVLQSTLDGFVVNTLAGEAKPVYSRERLALACLRFIAACDLVSCFACVYYIS